MEKGKEGSGKDLREATINGGDFSTGKELGKD